MNLKKYARQMVKKAEPSSPLAQKSSNYGKGNDAVNKLTTKKVKGPGSLLRKINPTTPHDMV